MEMEKEEKDYIWSTRKKVICPYCGYTLPILYDTSTNVKELLLYCKGRHCKRSFYLIIVNGIQKNLMPDDNLISDFKKIYGTDYTEHIRKTFGVNIT